MKQISARQFRTTFGSLTEPVIVRQRRPDGDLAVLGTWTPANEEPWKGGDALAAGFGASRPAPKPKR